MDPNPATEARGQGQAPAVAGGPGRVVLGPVRKGSLREHPLGGAWVFEGGRQGELLDIGMAEATGYTVVDLGDRWVPYIFSDKTPGLTDGSPNLYAQRYIDLANDKTDSDGDALPEHRHNYLELYGIPPTLTVLWEEWQQVETHVQSCLDSAGYDPTVFADFSGTLAFTWTGGKKRLRRERQQRSHLHRAMKKARLEGGDYEAAAVHPKTRAAHLAWTKTTREIEVLRHAQIRFRCERLYESKGGAGNSKPGNYDGATHHALAAFEKKHNLRGWGHFAKPNTTVLAQSAVESTHARLVRVLTERVVSAAGIIEDGSAAQWRSDFVWKDETGTEHKLRDLVSESSQAALTALGLDVPQNAKARLGELLSLMKKDENGLGQLLVAVRLPAPPAYYSSNMAFEAVIDRGDVWYDYPFDEEGKRETQRRRRKPRLTIYTTYLDQRIPLVRWRTTIGSWRTEVNEGREWYAYKNSDVGARVWKDIHAAPVWVPPASTPVKSLVKRKVKRGRWHTVVNYDETGPSYKSAYGLVAAYHIKQVKRDDGTVRAELDNQIRTHGSVDYMSILRRFSHGCHRLYNMNAVRLFSFILGHRDYVRHGQTYLGYRRLFEYKGEEHRISLNTRGYRYELPEPIKIVVTKGRIRGTRKTPYEDFMPKPGVDYTDSGEDGMTGDTSGGDSMLDFDEL